MNDPYLSTVDSGLQGRVESCPRGLAATVRGSFGMSHVHPSPCVRHMYYPALFATFPVDKQRITIVKLSSGAPGTMTTAMEGKEGTMPGGWWVFGWGKHFAVVTGTKARAGHVAAVA